LNFQCFFGQPREDWPRTRTSTPSYRTPPWKTKAGSVWSVL